MSEEKRIVALEERVRHLEIKNNELELNQLAIKRLIEKLITSK